MDSNLIGRQIVSYRLQEFIGDGGMGSVYRAYDLNLDRSVALKLMHPHFARQPEFRQRLTQEAQIAAKLDHPSIVKVYNFGESEEGLYIAMEYVRDGSLRSHLQRYQAAGRYMEVPLGLQIGIQIADALDYAHRENAIHRDAKPGNIILKRLARAEEDGFGPFRAVLTDFGLVQLLTGTRITEMGVTMGTPVYMSPEQCEGRNLDGRSDLYSLGVVLYEIFTNRPPFLFSSLPQAVAAHLRGEQPPMARALRPELPPLIDALLTKSLAKDSNARFSSGAQMEEALRSAFFSLTNSPTRVWQRPQIDRAETLDVTPPPGYTLVMRTPDHPITHLPLTKASYTLGRGPDNDIVLAVDGVSRHHARLQASAAGWAVVDLGGVNGTFLQGRRLAADQPTLLPPNQILAIGPYQLSLEMPGSAVGLTSELPTEVVPGRVRPAQPRLYALFVARDQISIEPGQTTNVHVEVENQSGAEDQIALRVHGLPADWYHSAEDFAPIQPGERLRLSVQIRPPRRIEPFGGRQRFRIELASQRYPDLKAGVSATLNLATYEAYEADITPTDLYLPGKVNVTVRNVGNTSGVYQAIGRQADDLIRFSGDVTPVELRADQSHTFEMALEGVQARPLMDTRTLPFEIEVQPATGRPRTLSGSAQQAPLLPGWLVYLGAFVFFSACFLTLLSVVFAPDRGRATVTPTTIAQTTTISGAGTPGSAETAIAATLTIISQSYTPVPPPNDNDADQLSNQQEQILGTDPNNPDSDQDGLNDGLEVLVYSSDPRRADTDGDGLTDPQEINQYGTLPNNPDTDGDGVWDGIEVSQGTNPRRSDLLPTPTSTPLATLTTPTPLPSLTPTPITPGATTLPSLTPTPPTPPSATPVATSTATPSATPVVSPTPSATPTASLTPSPTAIPSATPTPTLLPTLTPSTTPSATPSATPTSDLLTPTPVPLVCATTAPVVDGVITPEEWPAAPFVFALSGNPARTVTVYAAKTATGLYLGFISNDGTFEASDSLRLYFDVLNNGGDPDTPDRFIQLGRDGARTIQAGIGSNSDGETWDITYTSTFWVAAIDPGGADWRVEVLINTPEEMPALTAPFGLMVQNLFSGEGMANWPETGVFDQADTWRKIDNSAVCTP